MSVGSIIVVVVAVVATAALFVWFIVNHNSPEDTAGHTDAPASTTSEELYEGADRPAGPDVAVMDPDRLGGDHRPPTSSRPED